MQMTRLVGGSCIILLSIVKLGAANSDLADAVMNNKRDVVRSLVQQKVDVNAPQADGTTAVAWAVRGDDLETVDLLIRAGADVKAGNRDGATPLYLACVNGNAAMIEKLLNCAGR